MGTGGAPRHADGADPSARREALPGLDVDRTQMAVHADQSAPMVDEDGVAVEEEFARVHHGACDGDVHRSTDRRGDVHAAVRIARFAVEYAARAKRAAARTR